MSDAYFLLAPVAVLAILLLFRFVGCAAILDLDEVNYAPAGCRQTILDDAPVAYWRLQEPSSTTIPGGKAKDEKQLKDGTYRTLQLAPDPQFPDSPAAPGTLILGVQGSGLLKEGPSTSMKIDGGFVEVPFVNTLHAPSFTIEALVLPEWQQNERGFYRTVIESSGDDVLNSPTRGYAIYAGPEDDQNPNSDTVWQVWMGDASKWQKVVEAPSQHLKFDRPTYLAVTYNGSLTPPLLLYVYYADISNGLLSASASFSYKPKTGTSLLIGIGRNPPNLQLWPFKGRIQEVVVYNKALRIERIVSHASCFLGL